jgi:predicted ATPase
MRALAAPQVAVRLDDRFGLLPAGERTDLPCQQTLRATMDWSFRLTLFAHWCLLLSATRRTVGAV